MNCQSLEHLYSSKTDDELLALSAEEASLREDAKQILGRELRRRGLDAANTVRDGRINSSISPRVPRFLQSHRVGGILIFNVCVAILGTRALEAEIGSAIHPR